VDGREYTAKLIGADLPSDLAVLKIDDKDKLPVIQMGRSDGLMIGETVIAIGNPFGLSHTVTTGVISALDRSVRTEHRVYQDFIQTDAAINPGNSGGPLLNIDGELIGINAAIYRKAEGVGFAIPIDRARRIVKDLIHYGEVHPAWIGLEVQDLDERLVNYFKLEGKKGVLVTQVSPRGPADRAGIRKGDLIVAIGNTSIASREGFLQALAGYTAHSTLRMVVWREGLEETLRLKAQVLSLEQAQNEAETRLGIKVRAITSFLTQQYRLYSDIGVVVVDVSPQSLAHRSGIRVGDIIRQVNDLEIEALQDYQQAMTRALRRGNLLLLIQRGSRGYYLTLEIGGA
jgi:serine protease Do